MTCNCLIDFHRHVALWRTVQVVTAEHTAALDYFDINRIIRIINHRIAIIIHILNIGVLVCDPEICC